MLPYVLGIDSGGTKYLVRAAALDGTTLGEYRGSSCNHYEMGVEEAAHRIEHHLKECLKTFGGDPKDCVAIVSGSTGYDSPEDGEILQKLYDDLAQYDCPKCCMNDVELAHYSVTGGVGILTLAGTGSIVFGRNMNGEEGRVGGWHKSIFGDEGSGRYLDARALEFYSRWLDGCRPDTPLLHEIENVMGRMSRKQLMDISAKIGTPPWPGLDLGVAVNKAAEEGDPYAVAILKDSASKLFAMTDDAVCKLKMQKDTVLCIGLWGSVLLNCRIEQESFISLIKEKYPQAVFFLPEKDAAQGAVEIAISWHHNGGNWRDAMMHNAQNS